MARRGIQGTSVELEAAGRGAVVVVEGQMQGQQEGEERDGERAPLHGLAFVRQQREQDRARKRDEGDERKDGVVDVHRWVHRRLVKQKYDCVTSYSSLVHPDGCGRRS